MDPEIEPTPAIASQRAARPDDSPVRRWACLVAAWIDSGAIAEADASASMNGPAVQDLWLFLAGPRDEMAAQLGDLLEGYGKFADFDYRELRLIEALRALRLMHYTAWITRRWHDPAFPRAFPWLGEPRYWEEHVQALLEQRAALDEEPLAVVV